MRIAGAADGTVRAGSDRAQAGEVRCPSCSRLLVLRAGPAVTPHFAHRPRQSCRNRPGRAGIRPLQLEQLTLFDLELSAPPMEPFTAPGEREEPRENPRRAKHRRKRRQAWSARLVVWLKRNRRAG